MKLLAVALSLSIVGAFFLLLWKSRFQELNQVRAARVQTELELSQLARLEANLKARVGVINALRSQVRDEEKKLGLVSASDPARLDQEWAHLVHRPGLTVRRTGATMTDEPSLDVTVEAKGPRDEVFRLLNGMLRNQRPCQLISIDLKCSAGQASALMHWDVYWR